MDYSNITNIEFDGIDYDDCPDFVDAFIVSASWKDTGKDLTEDELDKLNNDSNFVYEALMDYLY